MGMVNAVIPHAELEETSYQWAQEILAKSPTSIRMLKFAAMNLTDDGMVGFNKFSLVKNQISYMTEEAKGRQKRILENVNQISAIISGFHNISNWQ